MASIAFSAATSALGGMALGPLGAAVGQVAGSMVGNSVDATLFGSNKNYNSEGHRLRNLGIQSSTYGKMLPVVYGKSKLAGNIIWAQDIIEVPTTEYTSYRTKRGKVSNAHTNFAYFANFAVSVCEGEIDDILNIWADTKLLNLENYTIRIYKGSETQLPDSLIESDIGLDKTPAFRGQAYVVFERFPLAEFGNRIPNFNFEVSRSLISNTSRSAEALVESLVIIPGSGEFVYDTKIQHKEDISWGSQFRKGKATSINMHNTFNIANSRVAIDQMVKTFPNLKWVSPVVNWFSTSTDAGTAKIMPGVEFKEGIKTSPGEWKVDNFIRSTAYEISKTPQGRPNYGGTPSDEAIINFIRELKFKGLKVMFNPMLLIDTPEKPWRGKIKAKNARDIKKFMGKGSEYYEFVRHYAILLRNLVDGFVIGSEFVGLTSQKFGGKYPAVECLKELAEVVKKTLAPGTIVTYAADWSEYHHNANGDFHMDELWSSDAIDVIGIDAYFPLTNQSGSEYNKAKLIKAWDEGEGVEYYFEDDAKKNLLPLSADYAWKNIKHWWENEHKNPGGKKTAWVPKSKKIWFTEYGFPSIDSCTNQPNVFFDPLGGDESKIPIHSNGETDFKAQRIAVEATELRWQNSEMVENKFLWTWDARPYPYWPQNNIAWSDGGSYLKGHWVQGKFGNSNLVEIIKHLCYKVGYLNTDIEFIDIDESIYGYIVDNQTSAIENLKILAKAFNFVILRNGRKITFKNVLKIKTHKVDYEHILEDRNKIFTYSYTNDRDLPNHIDVNFYDSGNKYYISTQSANKYIGSTAKNKSSISLPIVTSKGHARKIAEILMQESQISSHELSFSLPPIYKHLEVGDMVEIEIKDEIHKVLITKLALGQNFVVRLKAVRFEPSIYNVNYDADYQNIVESGGLAGRTEFEILDIPNLDNDPTSQNLYLAACGYLDTWKGSSIYMAKSESDTFVEVAEFNKPTTMGVVTNYLGESNSNLISYDNSIEVNLYSGDLDSIHSDLMGTNANLALIGNEIIQFESAELVDNYQFKLHGLVRGRFGTEAEISNHKPGDMFILLDDSVQKISLESFGLNRGQEIYFKPISFGNTFGNTKTISHKLEMNSLKPLSVVGVEEKELDEKILISWIRRSFSIGDFDSASSNKVLEFAEELYRVTLEFENHEIEEIFVHAPQIEIEKSKFEKMLSYKVQQLSEYYN